MGNHKDSTGIGLSIVKKIVEMYDGKIWLESKENIGTTFYIKLKK
jgi:signal transduction histidine kinase